MLNNEQLSLEKAIVITVSYPPGVCSLKAYRITSPGYEWGKHNRDINNINVAGFNTSFYEKVHLWLSEVFMGFFMIPDNQIWNYNFIGLKIDQNLRFNYVSGHPKEFYHEAHRSSHFINFNRLEEENTRDNDDEKEDHFE